MLDLIHICCVYAAVPSWEVLMESIGLDNRVVAAVILFVGVSALFFAFLPTRGKVLRSIWSILRAMASWKILFPFVLLVGWAVLAVFVAFIFGVWDLSLLTESVIVIVIGGFGVLFTASKALTGKGLVSEIMSPAISVIAIVAFYIGLVPLALWVEIPFQALLLVVVLIQAFTSDNKDHKTIFQLVNGILVLTGIGLLVWTTFQLVANSAEYDWVLIMKGFVALVWIRVAMVPYLYVFAVVSATETIFARLRGVNGTRPRRRVRLAIILGLHGSLKLANRFKGRYNDIGKVKTYKETRNAMKNFRNDVKSQQEREERRIIDLRDNAGKQGTDSSGAQFDRREYNETKHILDFIWMCQIGRYEGNGKRFWNDLTDAIVDIDSHRKALPKNHGFIVQTTKDRKKWRAWRVLPNGQVLGVGGTNKNNKYLHQGAKPPTSWPPTKAEWFDADKENLPSDWKKADTPAT